MSMLRFTAEASIYQSSVHYGGYPRTTNGAGMVSPAMYPGCMSRCVSMCQSDPNLYEFNDCEVACRCSCSGRRGCWQ